MWALNRGKEGRQAVNNSDYAITQFRYGSSHACHLSHARTMHEGNDKSPTQSTSKSLLYM
jgi:hypothetical protein